MARRGDRTRARHFALDGRVALVTGAMRGIGFETARALHARGAAVALSDIDAAGVAAATGRIGGDRVIGLTADVRDEVAVRAAVAATVERFGRLDLAVANAGIAPPPRTMLRMDAETFDGVLDVNLHGVVHTVRAALPEIVARRGHLVLVSSVYAFTNGMLQSPYAVAKAGVEQLGRALRVELHPHGASATVAYFGFVDTQMVAEAYADPIVQRLDRTIPAPLRRRVPPAAAAAAIVAGIERRAAHVILPRRWEILRRARGLSGPAGDELYRRHPVIQST
ncbi:MAG TPA: short-chain dehydrogenase/reductase, partial [Solirubrobacteraceae bacterium]|nr:short-chain dehydrogenase/reductase [Solirubrobacteraceae bacterium]